MSDVTEKILPSYPHTGWSGWGMSLPRETPLFDALAPDAQAGLLRRVFIGCEIESRIAWYLARNEWTIDHARMMAAIRCAKLPAVEWRELIATNPPWLPTMKSHAERALKAYRGTPNPTQATFCWVPRCVLSPSDPSGMMGSVVADWSAVIGYLQLPWEQASSLWYRGALASGTRQSMILGPRCAQTQNNRTASYALTVNRWESMRGPWTPPADAELLRPAHSGG